MQLSVERLLLLKTLQRVQGVIERKQTTVPIYGNVLLQTNKNMLHVKASSKDLGLEDAIHAHVIQPGATTVSASLLYDIMRKLPDGELINIHHLNNRLQVHTGHTSFELPTLPVDSFVSFSQDGFNQKFTLTMQEATALFRPRFCMSNEELRHFLNGLYLHSIKKNNKVYLRSVATDGHRLALHEISVSDDIANIPSSLIIPRRTILEISKFIESMSDQLLSIQIAPNKILFQINHVVFISQLVDGVFPDYEQVIPKNNIHVMSAQRIELLHAIDRVALITSDKNGIRLDLKKDKLHLSAKDKILGEAQEDIAVSYAGEPLVIGFNARYLLDAIHHASSETIYFAFQDAQTPLIVTPENDSSAFVIMPMHIA